MVIVIIMGVLGSGKTLIGQMLSQELGWDFFDADDFHPSANILKISRSIPLTDNDRKPWLKILNKLLQKSSQESKSAILACSALKQSYRDILVQDVPKTRFVYLKGDEELIRNRLKERSGHFAKDSLLASQFESLEAPSNAIIVEISQSPEKILEQIKKEIRQ
jgi:gluconokinase